MAVPPRAVTLRDEVISRHGYDPVLLDQYIVERCLELSAVDAIKEVRNRPRPDLIAAAKTDDVCNCEGGECGDSETYPDEPVRITESDEEDPGRTERYPPPENRIPEGTPADDAALHCKDDVCKTVEADGLGLVEGGYRNG